MSFTVLLKNCSVTLEKFMNSQKNTYNFEMRSQNASVR